MRATAGARPAFSDANKVGEVSLQPSSLSVAGHLQEGADLNGVVAALRFGLFEGEEMLLLGERAAAVQSDGRVWSEWRETAIAIEQGAISEAVYTAVEVTEGGTLLGIPLAYRVAGSGVAQRVALVLGLGPDGLERKRTFYADGGRGWEAIELGPGELRALKARPTGPCGAAAWAEGKIALDAAATFKVVERPIPVGQRVFLALTAANATGDGDCVSSELALP